MLQQVTEDNIEDIAIGAAILGTGGGGNPYVGKLLARELIREHGPIELVAVDDVPDDAFAFTPAMMGAPTVLVEKLMGGGELERAVHAVERYLGRTATHLLPAEVGGFNSVAPLCVAARLRLPVVDADCMGRAFPELQMVLPTLYGISASPLALADEKGNVAILDVVSNRWAERLARPAAVEMGCSAMIATYALDGPQIREATVPRTLSLAAELGGVVRHEQANHGDVAGAVAERLGGRHLFDGKIVDVERKVDPGFSRVESSLEGIGANTGESLVLHTQNEHLVAIVEERVVASTPDLIMLLDQDTGEPITTEDLRYGQRVSVLGAPCDERWRSEAGLALVGPRYFGYDLDYVPIGETVRV